MTPIEALVTAARKYCMDNLSYWANLNSDHDYETLPRNRILSAILGQVETLVDTVYPNLVDCRQALSLAGQTARAGFTSSFQNKISQSAIQDECDKFVDYVTTVTLGELGLVDPLPYTRRLNPTEQEDVRWRLLERWNFDGDYWDPLVEKCQETFIFLNKANCSKEDYSAIVSYIVQHAEAHLFEITEQGEDAEIANSLFDPDCYETIYCDRSFSWIVYGSHESTITFAGEKLIGFIQTLFADRPQLLNSWA